MSAQKNVDFSLYFVADVEFAAGRDLLAVVREAVLGGVTIVQLRAKTLETREFLDLAVRMNALLQRLRVPLLINDRTDIALACGAAGVHLGQDDLPLEAARKILGGKKIIGITVNSLKEARRAERLGADYIGLGPVYATSTKKTMKPLLGPQGVRRLRKKTLLPIVAIGGIHAANAPAIRRAGADGLAVVSAIMGAKDVRRAAAELKSLWLTASCASRKYLT